MWENSLRIATALASHSRLASTIIVFQHSLLWLLRIVKTSHCDIFTCSPLEKALKHRRGAHCASVLKLMLFSYQTGGYGIRPYGYELTKYTLQTRRGRRPRRPVTKIKYLLCENISFCLYEAVTIFSYPSLRTVEDACPYNNV